MRDNDPDRTPQMMGGIKVETRIAGVPVHVDDSGLQYVRFSEIPENARARFYGWMVGQAIPCIEGVPDGDAVYVWDWRRYAAHHQALLNVPTSPSPDEPSEQDTSSEEQIR